MCKCSLTLFFSLFILFFLPGRSLHLSSLHPPCHAFPKHTQIQTSPHMATVLKALSETKPAKGSIDMW